MRCMLSLMLIQINNEQFYQLWLFETAIFYVLIYGENNWNEKN